MSTRSDISWFIGTMFISANLVSLVAQMVKNQPVMQENQV